MAESKGVYAAAHRQLFGPGNSDNLVSFGHASISPLCYYFLQQSSSYDAVTVAGAFAKEHLQPAPAVREIARILKTGLKKYPCSI